MKITVAEMTETALFAALICLASFILKIGGEVMVPFSILPLLVLLSGSLLGPRLGALSVTLYVLLGFLGIPVFAQAPFGGVTYFLHPSCGFLFGFIGAAYVTGWLVEKIPAWGLAQYLVAMLLGVLVLNLIGIPYFYLVLKFYLGQTLSLGGVLKIGFLPFIAFDLLKAVCAALITQRVKKRLR